MAYRNGTNSSETINWRYQPLNGNGDTSHAIYGNGGNDIIYGAWNIVNFIDGGIGNDFLYGGYMDDILDGWDGQDTLQGDKGNDLLIGRFGDDYLVGGEGTDRLRGNQGNDTYVIKLNELGVDTVADDTDAANGAGSGGGIDTLRIADSSAANLYIFWQGDNLHITSNADAADDTQDNGVILYNQALGGNHIIERLIDSTGTIYDLTLIG